MLKDVKVTEKSTIPSVLNDRIAVHSEQVALIEGDNRLTYKEVGDSVHHIATVFQELGIQRGEKIALIYQNGIKFTVALMAVYHMGAVPLSVDPTLKPNEIIHILNDSDAVAVVIGDQFSDLDPLGTIERIKNRLPNLRHLVVDGIETRYGILLSDLLEETKPRRVNVSIDPDDLAVLIYTSGTTGLPKGGMHTHRSQLVPIKGDSFNKKPTVRSAVLMIKRYGIKYVFRFVKIINKPLVYMTSAPSSTAAGVFGAVMSLLTGKTLVIENRFTPIEAIKIIEKEKVNVFFVVPSLVALITKHPDLRNHDLSSLLFIMTGAAYVSPTLANEIRVKIGCPVMIGYGGTEFGTPTMTNPFSDSEKALRETVGKVGENYELRIVDEDHHDLPTGEVGEIVVRGPSLMRGYYKDEETTRRVFDKDGWVYTGDLGKLDEEGYLRIAGRIKDMIIRAGQNIYPAELEDVLITHPNIHRAAVVGVPDDLSGEKAIAFIIPNEGIYLDKVEVLNFCRENMAPYKVPNDVRFKDDFPLNPSGKVLKRLLREEVMAEIYR